MGYKGNVGGYDNYSDNGGYGSGAAFALLVVLFILLVIVGVAFIC